MGFSPTYPVGGIIDEVKKINFPPHLFPTKHLPFTKGFRIDIPATMGVYVEVYEAPVDMELVDVGLACSGYGDEDYWEMVIGTDKTIETMYTKEVPQSINMGTTMYVVHQVPATTQIRLEFHNDSGTSKTVWFDLRFLK